MNNTLSKTVRYIAIILLLLTGINAVVAGILFILDTSGGKMGMSVAYLSHSPFRSFLVPGIVLLVVNGLLNFVAGFLTLYKYKHYPYLIILQGLLLSGWIIIQVLLVKDFNGLHVTMLSIGIVLLSCGLILKGRSDAPRNS